MSEKSPEAFRTISEVADELDLPQHVLRFWETRFGQIKPMKRGGGRRYYRPEDVNLLRGIRHLLYGEGYTIKGVQRILKEQGVRHVMAVWLDEGAPATDAPPRAVEEPVLDEFDDDDGEPLPIETPATPARTVDRRPGADAAVAVRASPPPVEAPAPAAVAAPAPATEDIYAPKPRAVRQEPPGPAGAAPARPAGIPAEQGRQLKAALFELLECKRLLDEARRAD